MIYSKMYRLFSWSDSLRIISGISFFVLYWYSIYTNIIREYFVIFLICWVITPIRKGFVVWFRVLLFSQLFFYVLLKQKFGNLYCKNKLNSSVEFVLILGLVWNPPEFCFVLFLNYILTFFKGESLHKNWWTSCYSSQIR